MKEHVILMNPMREYIHKFDDHVEEMFQSFKSKHNKVYKTDEHHQRKHNFRQNVRFVLGKKENMCVYHHMLKKIRVDQLD